jgi:hypothetical protein
LGVDFIVFFVGSDEPNIDGEERIIDPDHKTVFVAADIEHERQCVTANSPANPRAHS